MALAEGVPDRVSGTRGLLDRGGSNGSADLSTGRGLLGLTEGVGLAAVARHICVLIAFKGYPLAMRHLPQVDPAPAMSARSAVVCSSPHRRSGSTTDGSKASSSYDTVWDYPQGGTFPCRVNI
jgi:hypothetical protein